MGLQIITPLRRKDGSIVLINRGWVPAIMKEPETRKEAQLTEKVTILGHLMPSEEQQGFTLGTGKALFKSLNVPERNFWSRIDLEEMADWVNASPIMVSALVDPPNPGGYPIGGQTDFQIDNWLRTEAYQLGGTALFMFAALVGSRYLARLGRMPWQKAPPKGTPFSD
jgi:surfeit locus 1 family protein